MNSTTLAVLQRWLQQHEDRIALAFLVLLFGFTATYLLSLTIRMTDTDLWYHLAGGRYLIESGQLYNPLVNSYLEVEREFINYFWGFQLSVYLGWLVAGEIGLILLKAALFFAAALLAMKVVLEGRAVRDTSFLQLLVIGLVVAILCMRGLSLRPHLVSYVMIPAYIFILAYRPRWYPLLPLLTVVWVNLHGIEWVVGGLICGAYFLQHLLNLRSMRPVERSAKPMIWISLCLPAMLLSPHHFHLLAVPFIHDSGIADFIGELQRPEIFAIPRFSDGFSLDALVLALLAFLMVSAWHAVRDLRRNIAPLVLAIGGVILLLTARRFTWEWTLLSLPLLATGLRYWRGPQAGGLTTAALALFLATMSVTFWPAMKKGIQDYPLDRPSLPWGTTEFIAQNGLKGRYMIDPSFAGYIEFVLTPGVKIHMDMQLPPFTSLDFHNFMSAILTPSGLTRYVEQFNPGLLGVRSGNTVFPDSTARELGYVPVFFDEQIVLYARRDRFPGIVESYGINAINPYNPDQFRPGQAAEAIQEMESMLAVVDMPDLRLSLIGLLIEQGELEKAQHHLLAAEKGFPAAGRTSYFSGRLAHLQSDCATAVAHYENAVAIAEEPEPIQRFAAECYFVIGNQRLAYQHFQAAINPYRDKNPDALTYYQYALSAAGVGEFEEARRLLTMIRRFDPGSELMPRIESLLSQLESAT